jgi:hypothetical protein
MGKSRLIAILAGVCAAALLVMLTLPMPVDSAERILAYTLVVALIVLILFLVRADQGALKKFGDAKNELEAKLGGMQQQLADSNAFNQSVLDGVPDPAGDHHRHGFQRYLDKQGRPRGPGWRCRRR